MPRQNKRLQEVRDAGAARLEDRVSRKTKAQRKKEASTRLQCYNIVNKSVFVQGLQKAGLRVVSLPFSGGDYPDQVIIALHSQEEARQIINAFHGSPMEGRAVQICIIALGTQKGNAQKGNEQAHLPKVKHIRRCVSDAFIKLASKEGLAREAPKHAVDTPKARANTQVPEVAIKLEEVDGYLVTETEGEKAMERMESGGHESEGLGEQINEPENVEEPIEMREDSFRPEPYAKQQMEAGGTRSDLRGERCQIQDTARVIMPTRSPTPEDFLSALLAYLDEGKDTVVDEQRGFDTVDNIV